MITFENDLKEFLRVLDPVLVQKAQTSALTRIRKKAATHISKTTRSRYNISAGAVRDALERRTKFKLSQDKSSAFITYIGARIGMINFSAKFKPVQTARGPRHGATAKLYKSRPRSLVPGGFIAAGRGGNVHIFRRQKKSQKSRLPIEAVTGPSVPQMISGDEVIRETDRFVQEEYPIELIRQIDYQLSRL